MHTKDFKRIFFAGGCFWGVEAYFKQLKGVEDTVSGYAQGHVENPSYELVSTGQSGYTETVMVVYNPLAISLESLCDHYFRIIDPFTLNKQGNDIGSQYRSGIYFDDINDKKELEEIYNAYQCQSSKDFVVELEALKNFVPAEDYHQDYLDKNPGSYCHIDLKLAEDEEKKEEVN